MQKKFKFSKCCLPGRVETNCLHYCFLTDYWIDIFSYLDQKHDLIMYHLESKVRLVSFEQPAKRAPSPIRSQFWNWVGRAVRSGSLRLDGWCLDLSWIDAFCFVLLRVCWNCSEKWHIFSRCCCHLFIRFFLKSDIPPAYYSLTE